MTEAIQQQRGGRLLAGAIRGAGVDTVFGLGGGHIMPALDAARPAGLRVVDTRHEGAAALAAEGWALATGQAGCALVTAGPGFTNALTGLFDAGVWNVPMVLVGGRSGLRVAGQGAVGELDQRAIAAPGVKWSVTCPEARRLPRFVAEAFHRARAGRPGAVYLEVPGDVMEGRGEWPEGSLEGFPDPMPKPTAPRGDVERAVDLIRRSERPLVLAGGGAFWSGASEPLARFLEVTGLPLTTTSSARGLVPDGHPNCIGSLVHGGISLLSADLVLILGSAFNANLGYGRPPLFGIDQRIVQVDITAEGMGGNRRCDVGLVGDVGMVLADLSEAWRVSGAGPDRYRTWLSDTTEWASASLGTWDDQIDGYAGSGLHAGAVAREMAAFAREATGGACTLVADGGDALAWALGYFFAEGPGRMLSTTTALGTLGVGLPFALAAKAARPQEPVLALVGDGSFGLSAMEIDTMVRHDLAVTVVVSDNRGWGDLRHFPAEGGDHGPRVAAELSSLRYDRLAEALGAHGEHVTRLDQLRGALDRSLAGGRPAVIDVDTDPQVEAALLRIIGEMELM